MHSYVSDLVAFVVTSDIFGYNRVAFPQICPTSWKSVIVLL